MEDMEPQFDPFWFNPVTFFKWWWQRLSTSVRTIKERGGWSYIAAFCLDWFIYQGYLLDWILAIAGYIFSSKVLVIMQPNSYYIVPEDPRFSYPYQNGFSHDALGNLGLFFWMVPIVIIGITSGLMVSFYDLHTGVLGLVWTNCIGCNFKQFMNLVGFPRPYWFSVNGEGDYPYSNATDFEIQFARQAFPSGHASYSMQALCYIFIYLLAKFRIMQNPGPGHLFKLFIAFSPIGLAVYISMTRLVRYIHHPADVTCGMFMGVCFAVAGYFSFYPSLYHPRCWLPTPRKGQLAWEAKWAGGQTRREQSGVEAPSSSAKTGDDYLIKTPEPNSGA